MHVSRLVPRKLRLAAKAWVYAARRAVVRAFRRYDGGELLAAIRSLGVMPGDAVMLHSAFEPHHGFRGTVHALIDVFVEAVGPSGHLLMVSLPYRSSSLAYLQSGRRFDVRRTPSMMGMVSEMFRRRPGVLRSLHPTHPVLVAGPQAERFVAAHPLCRYPCGPGTPFDELARADGKVLFFNAAFDTITFFHWLEHMVHEHLPFALYTDTPFDVTVIDADGHGRTVTTYVFAESAIRRRRFERFEQAMRERGAIRACRVGNSHLLAVDLKDAIACTQGMLQAGRLFYELNDPVVPSHAPPPT
jgi:aminoglycoside 3-N-acetyltransferase